MLLLSTQIGPLHDVARPHGFYVSLQNNPPDLKRTSRMRNTEGQMDILLDEENSDAGFVDSRGGEQ